MLFWGWIVICDLYLFHFIVPLNPEFNCSKSLISFSFDKLTAGTCDGMCHAIHLYVKTNNKYMKGYDKNKE